MKAPPWLRPERTASQLESWPSIPPIHHGNRRYHTYPVQPRGRGCTGPVILIVRQEKKRASWTCLSPCNTVSP